jgi:hypothetical protein
LYAICIHFSERIPKYILTLSNWSVSCLYMSGRKLQDLNEFSEIVHKENCCVPKSTSTAKNRPDQQKLNKKIIAYFIKWNTWTLQTETAHITKHLALTRSADI